MKHTLYVKYPTFKSGSSIDKQFMDIYNCGSYELIPYINKKHSTVNLKVGTLHVQMYWLLMDVWLLKLVNHIKGITDSQYSVKYKYTLNTIKYLKKNMPITYSKLFIGINYDEKIEQRIIISKNQIKKTSYYPELSMSKSKKYKLIATSS